MNCECVFTLALQGLLCFPKSEDALGVLGSMYFNDHSSTLGNFPMHGYLARGEKRNCGASVL